MYIRYGTWLVIPFMYASIAFGQPSNPRISEILRRGVDLRQQGQDEAALQEFRRALQLSSEPRITAQIALAEQALQRWPEADRHLRDALAASHDQYIARHRAVLESSLREIGRHLGSVLVTGGVVGAELRINGARVGTLPMQEPVRVRTGLVTIELTAAGYATTTRDLTVVAGATVREHVLLSSSASAARMPTDRVGSRERSHDLASSGTDDSSPGSAQRTWGWITLVSGIGLVAGGVAGLAIHDGDVTDFNNRGCYVPPGTATVQGPGVFLAACNADYDSIAGTLGIVGLAGGGALTALSVVLLTTAPSGNSELRRQATRFSCGQGPGQFGIACSGTF